MNKEKLQQSILKLEAELADMKAQLEQEEKCELMMNKIIVLLR